MMYNRREIMKRAWSMYRAAKLFRNGQTFADCLKLAWSDAKMMVTPPVKVARTVSVPATITARELRTGDIVTIEYGTYDNFITVQVTKIAPTQFSREYLSIGFKYVNGHDNGLLFCANPSEKIALIARPAGCHIWTSPAA